MSPRQLDTPHHVFERAAKIPFGTAHLISFKPGAIEHEDKRRLVGSPAKNGGLRLRDAAHSCSTHAGVVETLDA
jgi:hypothetical protein